jgi:LysR family transcriptional regulator, hydrogen peroxide-inducible genes activator
MSNYLPSLRQLRYLVALHELGHFGRAAKANFVNQSTLSAGIADLERHLGVVLVERTKRSVRFTAVGDQLVERARRLIRGAEDLTDLARAAADPLTGEVRFAIIPTIAPFLLARIIPQIRADWPKLALFVREMSSPVACEALQRGQVDCVLLALPFACGDVEEVAIMSDQLLLATAAVDRPKTVPVPADAIDIDRLLLLEDGHCLTDHALTACGRDGPLGAAPMLCTSLHTLVQMVDQGLGFTLLPEMAVNAGILHETDVRVYPLANTGAIRRIALVWRRENARAPEYRLLATSIMAAVPGAVADARSHERSKPVVPPR